MIVGGELARFRERIRQLILLKSPHLPLGSREP